MAVLPSGDHVIVRCAKCETEFALDDGRVGPEGTTARCSLCGAVFAVAAPQGATAPPWQVRTIDDLLFTAPDLPTLHKWILEGRLHPDDRVSRSGRNFVRLGEMPELSEAFSGFVGLPGVLEAEPDRGASERSALDVLGPPPAFGTHAGDDDAALAGVPEPASVEPSSMLGQLVDEAASASASFVAVDAALPRAREPELAAPVADAPSNRRATPPPVPRSAAPRRPTPMPTRGVPALVADDRSSRPQSMLDVVTQHVRPIPAPAVETTRADAPAVARPAVERAASPPVVDVVPATIERSGGRSGWMMWAALGLLAGGAVVFGIPQVRARILGTTTPVATAEVAAPAEVSLDRARDAIAACDPESLAQAAASLQAAIDDGRGGPQARAAAAEALATRAVVHELWAAVEPSVRSDARFWAQEDAARAVGLLAGLDDAPEAARAHLLLRIVQGRADAEGLGVDDEGKLLVAVAPLLRDGSAKLPAAVMAGLEALPQPSALARLVLALGHLRAGDDAAARRVAGLVLGERPTQPVARVLQRGAAPPIADASKPGPANPDTSPTAKPELVASPGPQADPAPTDGDDAPVVIAPDDAKVEESPARLVDRGCAKSESGDATAAVALLTRALAKRPTDVDGLLCMGDAQSKLGAWGTALSHYERALARSPNMMSALAGAARAAAKLGKTSKAVQLYERLLDNDPSHAQAKAYVSANKSGDTPDQPG
jgi:predicted Zn finger-like uncharacterized protein